MAGLQRSAVCLGGAVAGVGVAAQAQDHVEREGVVHRQAERTQGEAESDDLGHGDQVRLVLDAVGVHRLDRGRRARATSPLLAARNIGTKKALRSLSGRRPWGDGLGRVLMAAFYRLSRFRVKNDFLFWVARMALDQDVI